MPETKCGFDSGKGFSGCDLLVTYGPTLVVNIGFDPDYNPQAPKGPPVLAVTGLRALVDTGATESCIDNLLAVQLNLSIVDRRPISGVHGRKEANMYLAQVHIPTLNFTRGLSISL